ncbi:MAG: hypothetical protein WC942_05545 [Clostridia bacterium]|jgi:hypothetical protein
MKRYISEASIDDALFNNHVTAALMTLTKTYVSDTPVDTDPPAGVKASVFDIDKNPELLYGSAILVSASMNGNDDLFLPSELCKSFRTAISTPYNISHNEKEIVGHIFEARLLNADGEWLSDVPSDQDEVDVEIDFVLYKHIYPEIAKQVIDGYMDGSYGVSMECYMEDFDYAMYDETLGSVQIVRRNPETSFLTQYLRVYGGRGYYQNKRIGRALRQVTFKGVAHTEIPANLRSVYTYVHAPEKRPLEPTKAFLYLTKENVMTIETLEQAQSVIAELEAKLAALEAEKVAEAEKLTEKISEVDALQAKLSIAEQSVASITEQHEAAKAELDQTKGQLDSTVAELAKLNQERVLAERIAQLAEVNVAVDSDDEKARIAGMTDEVFASILTYAAKAKDSTKADVTDADGDPLDIAEPTEPTVEDVVASDQGVDPAAREVAIAKATAEHLLNYRKPIKK